MLSRPRSIFLVCLFCLAVGIDCSRDQDDSTSVPVAPLQTTPHTQVTDSPQEEFTPQQHPDDQATHPQEAAAETEDDSKIQRLDKMRNLADLLLFQPLPFPEGNWQPVDLTLEDAWFDAVDGSRLHGWYCPVANATGTVIYAHGNAGNLSHRAEGIRRLQRRFGWNVFIFDYRGYGRSAGKPTSTGVVEDGAAALQWLLNRTKLDAGDVIFLGRSLGCAIVTQLAAEYGGKALILESPFLSLRDAAAAHYPRTLVVLATPDRLKTGDVIGKFHGPVIVCHGSADEVVPFVHGKTLFDLANEPKLFVELPNLGHNDPPPDWYYDRVAAFLASESSGSPSARND